MVTVKFAQRQPITFAVRQALRGNNNSALEADLLFLEAWELYPSAHLGVTLRASQIRRANPELAAAIDAELKAAHFLACRERSGSGQTVKTGQIALKAHGS